jgi:hypothetical protein
MFTGYIGIGFVAGTFLFFGKFVIYKMIMGLFPKGFSRWVHNTPFALILVDFMFAGLAAPIAGMAGGTIAMLTMITFGAESAAYIAIRVIINKINNMFSRMKPRAPAWR